MNSDKKSALLTAQILKEKGVQHVVISPGSRNAPLIISITSDSYFKCYSIVDERSAGFFALGLCQHLQNTVAVLCTSGTAALNLAPAVAEAYYQRLPLLVLTADRPNEWVNQGESQTMDQKNLYQNYIRASYDLTQEPNQGDDVWFFARQMNEAINHTTKPYFGPVHINIRFKEPLYNSAKQIEINSNLLNELDVEHSLPKEVLEKLKKTWNSYSKVMIICGQMSPDEKLNKTLDHLAQKGVTVLTESTSNMPGNSFVACIDKLIIPHFSKDTEKLTPELLITIGGPLISRKIKQEFRNSSIQEHWHIDPIDHYNDGFQKQTQAIKMSGKNFLIQFEGEKAKSSDYKDLWLILAKRSELNHEKFMDSAPFSDLKVFETILKKVPENTNLQIGNSSAIRYVQLFNERRELTCFANRGTSGIEGSVSTAVGQSLLSKKNTLLICGDLSMMYDSNGLWNNYLSPKLKIIVINNQGGGIFRIIDGPKKVSRFEDFIETKSTTNFEKLTEMHGLKYFKASGNDELLKVIDSFFDEKNKASLLEIETPREENDKVLMNYFEALKN